MAAEVRRGRTPTEATLIDPPTPTGLHAGEGATIHGIGQPAPAALRDDLDRDRVRRPDMNRRVAALKETVNGTAYAFAEAYLHRSADVLRAIQAGELAEVIAVLNNARAERRQVFICGNGGSAATASHFAAGLGKEGSAQSGRRFRTLALTDNVAWLTSLANDSDYAQVFVEQLKNHAESDDVLIVFSGSGNSRNVLTAVEWANAHGLVTVGVTGRPGGELAALARHCVCVSSSHMGHVEEGHFLIQHLITYYFMEARADDRER
jgi:D-sedoheptulose 7-phosphate isomerase